ncbi:MAG: hypothetical protein HY976_01885 [Candidatus Kerfeldbacteria bacterium]|nr:hypothetical protein [Candidatus Kerfeldbacteria bacterium]
MPKALKELGIKLLRAIFGIALIVFLIWLGMSCQRKKEAKFPWNGSFSAVSDERSRILASDEFKTLDECRRWAADQAKSRDLSAGEWAFSCGTDCTFKDDTIAGGKRIKTYTCREVITE